MVKVKFKDIAKASGVSVATVSAALNDTPGVSLKRKEEILKIADSLGYQPNIAARLLKQNKIEDLALIINELPTNIIGSGVYHSIVSAFVHECGREGLRNQIELTDSQQEKMPQCISGGLAGGALHVGVLSPELKKWLERHPDFPLVQLDEVYKYCVTIDAESGIQDSVQYLAAMGHRKIAMLCGPQNFHIHRLYLKAFKKVSDEFCLEKSADWLVELKLGRDIDSVKESQLASRKLLSAENRPTAVICADMRSASALIYESLSMGLKIPEDLSIIGSGAGWEAEKSCPALTSIEIDWEATVAIAMNMLRRLMKGLEVDTPRQQTRMNLIKRGSVHNINK